jgi:hypothetical protein
LEIASISKLRSTWGASTGRYYDGLPAPGEQTALAALSMQPTESKRFLPRPVAAHPEPNENAWLLGQALMNADG